MQRFLSGVRLLVVGDVVLRLSIFTENVCALELAVISPPLLKYVYVLDNI